VHATPSDVAPLGFPLGRARRGRLQWICCPRRTVDLLAEGNSDDDQIEYGPSDLSARSDASLAAVAALVALLDGGADAVTPTGLSAIEPSLTYVKGVSKRPGQVSVISASNAVGRRDVAIGYVLLVAQYSVGDGVQTFGLGSPCTGRAALGAERETW
jgi:hypothetical protein